MRRPAVLLALALLLGGSYLLVLGSGGASPVRQSDTTATGDASIGRVDLGFKSEIAPLPGVTPGDGTAMIRTGSQTLSVESIDAAITEAERLAKKIGAILVGSSRGEGYGVYDANGVFRNVAGGPATLVYRIEADRFEEIRRVFLPLGELLSENSSSSDVSSSLRDLGARLTSLRAAEAAYLELYKRATTVDEILNVQSRLDGLRAEIESMSAQQKALEEQVDLSTFTLTLQPKAAPISEASERFDLGQTVSEAVAALISVAQNIAVGLIYLVVFALPLLLLFLLWRVLRRVRR